MHSVRSISHEYYVVMSKIAIWRAKMLLANGNSQKYEKKNYDNGCIIKIRHEKKIFWFDLVYLFNGISTPYGLYNTEIWLISQYVTIMIITYIWIGLVWFGLFYQRLINSLWVI